MCVQGCDPAAQAPPFPLPQLGAATQSCLCVCPPPSPCPAGQADADRSRDAQQLRQQVDERWEGRIAGGDPVLRGCQRDQVEARMDDWLNKAIIKHEDNKWVAACGAQGGALGGGVRGGRGAGGQQQGASLGGSRGCLCGRALHVWMLPAMPARLAVPATLPRLPGTSHCTPASQRRPATARWSAAASSGPHGHCVASPLGPSRQYRTFCYPITSTLLSCRVSCRIRLGRLPWYHPPHHHTTTTSTGAASSTAGSLDCSHSPRVAASQLDARHAAQPCACLLCDTTQVSGADRRLGVHPASRGPPSAMAPPQPPFFHHTDLIVGHVCIAASSS